MGRGDYARPDGSPDGQGAEVRRDEVRQAQTPLKPRQVG
jgi:hypothetical protein